MTSHAVSIMHFCSSVKALYRRDIHDLHIEFLIIIRISPMLTSTNPNVLSHQGETDRKYVGGVNPTESGVITDSRTRYLYLSEGLYFTNVSHPFVFVCISFLLLSPFTGDETILWVI